jgi:GT2 family glycosyltransferase
MHNCPNQLVVFVPCFNRKDITSRFLASIYSLVPKSLSLSVHLLDDGSTDGTSDLISSNWPNVRIHQLDGSQFWGGSLNTIQHLLANPFFLQIVPGTDPWVMIANDDISFPLGSFEYALKMIDVVNFNFDILAPALVDGWGRVSFDASTGRFIEHPSCGSSNLAVTMATFMRRSTWLQAEPIPKGIPHYLADYWFTHSLSCKGFFITTIPEFKVITRSDTTRSSGPSGSGLFSRYDYWRRCVDPRSPDYLPAYIVFTQRFSSEPYKFWVLLLLRIKYFCFRILTGYRHEFIAALQA